MEIKKELTKEFNLFSKEEREALEMSTEAELSLFSGKKKSLKALETELEDLFYTTEHENLNAIIPNGDEIFDKYTDLLITKINTKQKEYRKKFESTSASKLAISM